MKSNSVHLLALSAEKVLDAYDVGSALYTHMEAMRGSLQILLAEAAALADAEKRK